MREKKRVRVLLQGGIGNQLFQLFAGLHISINQDKYLELDYSYIRTRNKHKNSLAELTLPYQELIWQGNQRGQTKGSTLLLMNLFELSPRTKKLFCKVGLIYEPREIGYLSDLKDAQAKLYIQGYFQSYRYLDSVSEATGVNLKRDIGVRNPTRKFLELLNNAQETRPIIVQIRRGDYLKLKKTFGVLSENYFLNALKNHSPLVEDREIWIFSDEIESAESLGKRLKDRRWRLIPPELNSIENLMLMAHGSGHVISNSTFGWWGAALADNSAKVIYPETWFRNLPIPQDLIPISWTPEESIWLD